MRPLAVPGAGQRVLLLRRLLPLLLQQLGSARCAVTLPATQYTGESADLGSYSVEIGVGRPPQMIRVQIDTGSGYVAVPSTRDDCAACSSDPASGGRVYDRALSRSARPVPCHSHECLHFPGGESADSAATICALQIGDTQVCPRPGGAAAAAAAADGELLAFDGRMGPAGAGQCLLDPAVVPGPGAILCNDHLEVDTDKGEPVSGEPS
eukprot:COSAG06_NODE_795_length_12228_cov_51.650507_9_plen_209_part_00